MKKITQAEIDRMFRPAEFEESASHVFKQLQYRYLNQSECEHLFEFRIAAAGFLPVEQCRKCLKLKRPLIID